MRLFIWGVRLWELRNNRKLQIVPLESVRGRLREWPLTGMCKYRVCMSLYKVLPRRSLVELSAYERVRSESFDCTSNFTIQNSKTAKAAAVHVLEQFF